MTVAEADPGLHPAVIQALGRKPHFITPRGARVVLAEPLGKPVYFVVDNGADRIHKRQAKGHFYEQDVLMVLAERLPAGGVFVDIGANIGNHSLFMALHGGASRVIPMEPNPAAIRLLAAVMRLNRIEEKVGFGALGYGIGDRNSAGFGVVAPKDNLGWARMVEGAGGIELRTGDSLLSGEPRIDMIKIDVEGMEIATLSGLKATIETHRPLLFIEVDHENRDAFDRWMEQTGYGIAQNFPASRVNQNLILEPRR